MNTIHDDAFDERLRQLHAQAVAQVSDRTLGRLRRRGVMAAERRWPARAFAWPLAAACVLGVLAIGLQWQRPDAPMPAAPPVAGMAEDEFSGTYAALDETPDLYVWLASSDASALAME